MILKVLVVLTMISPSLCAFERALDIQRTLDELVASHHELSMKSEDDEDPYDASAALGLSMEAIAVSHRASDITKSALPHHKRAKAEHKVAMQAMSTDDTTAARAAAQAAIAAAQDAYKAVLDYEANLPGFEPLPRGALETIPEGDESVSDTETEPTRKRRFIKG